MRRSLWFVFPLLILIAAISPEAMGQKKLSAVAPGHWGGTGVQFVVEKDSVTIEYDCAVGRIREPLKIDKAGKFVAEGFHKRETPGPIRLKFQPKELPARYEGKITSRVMKYKVILKETGEVVGEFSVERGKEGRVRKCR